MKKAIGIGLSLFAMAACSAANAADLPLKARPRPAPEPTWWFSAGALIWGVKSAPLPPTLTTFAPGTPSATTGFGGALGVAGTTVLSPGNLNYDTLGGGRFTLGHWLADPRFGFEVDGFFLASKNESFSDTSSGAAGSASLRIPFVNVPPGAGFPLGSSSFVLADPGFATGGQTITSSINFWGVEGNGLYRGVTSGPLNVSLLAGVRYINLSERLTILSTESLLTVPNASFAATDIFSTENQFFGAQIGVKAQQQFGRFDASGTAKIALGDNYQTVSMNGFSSASAGFGTAPSAPAGIFAQATNIGQQSRNRFAYVPEAQVQVGYTLPGGVRLFAGYEALYMSDVVRPGNQIDTTVNFTGNALVTPGTTLTGAARPAAQFGSSSFWAQGVKLGASYAF